VVGTFGRSIYILDDYSPLRTDAAALEDNEATLFPVKDAWLYIEREANTGTQGAEFYVADNPPFGAVLTYYLRDGLKTLKQQRRDKERPIELERGDTPYPGWDEIRAEDRENKPAVMVEIKDQSGNIVQRLDGPVDKGLHRISWNLRLPNPSLVDMGPKGPWYEEPVGPLVIPGGFTATLYKRQGGDLTALGTQSFNVKRLEHSPEHSSSPEQVLAFQKETVQFAQTVAAAEEIFEDFTNRVAHLKLSLTRTTADVEPLQQRISEIESSMDEVKVKLLGDKSKTSRNEAAAWSVSQRVMRLFWHWKSQFDVPGTYKSSLDIARQEYESVRADLEAIAAELDELESDADTIGVPWTPGRKIR